MPRYLIQNVEVMEGCLVEVVCKLRYKEVVGISQKENNRESKCPSKESRQIQDKRIGKKFRMAEMKVQKGKKSGGRGWREKKGHHDKGVSKLCSTSRISFKCIWLEGPM